MKGVDKKAPPGWLAVPNKSMTYIDLAKLFNADAVTYNIFIREFYPFGSGEPLVVRTHKALRPTNIKQGTHVPDPNHELWKKYFAKLTKQTLAVKPIITKSNTRENKLDLVAWDNPVPLHVWLVPRQSQGPVHARAAVLCAPNPTGQGRENRCSESQLLSATRRKIQD